MASQDDVKVEISNTQSPDGNPVASERSRTAVVVDRAGNRAWSAEGATDSEAATKAVRGFLGDRRSREYVG